MSQTLDVQEHYSLPWRDEQIPSRLDHAIYVKMGMQWWLAEATADNFLIHPIKYHLRPDLPQDKDTVLQ